MARPRTPVSRRDVLAGLSAAAGAGLAGCSALTGDSAPTSTPTATPTATPDRPNIERQVILRDRAAITHVRQTVTGTISWPEVQVYSLVDPDLLGRWREDQHMAEFRPDRSFVETGEGFDNSGTYYTVPPENLLHIEYDDGDQVDVNYRIEGQGSGRTLEITTTEGDPVASMAIERNIEDQRPVPAVFEELRFREDPEGGTASADLQTGSAGSGFIVSPEGHVVTNAHVVGTHKDPREYLYYQLGYNRARDLRADLEQDYDLTEREMQRVIETFSARFAGYVGEKSTVDSSDSSVGVLSGTAEPGDDFEAQSWAATVETAGTVTRMVSGEPSWGRDVALLSIDVPHPLPTVPLGDSTDLGTGSTLFAIGYPDLGIEQLFEERDTTLEPSLTSGVVSARRTLNSGLETIQTDAAINAGNSGGPMYDGEGNVVGIATFKPRDVQLEQVAFGLPIEVAKGFMSELGVESRPGELTEAYRAGLEALWRDDCAGVEEQMGRVLELWPDHPYAQDVIDSC